MSIIRDTFDTFAGLARHAAAEAAAGNYGHAAVDGAFAAFPLVVAAVIVATVAILAADPVRALAARVRAALAPRECAECDHPRYTLASALVALLPARECGKCECVHALLAPCPVAYADWEVFDPRDGIPVAAYGTERRARRAARRAGLDYGRTGDGWLDRPVPAYSTHDGRVLDALGIPVAEYRPGTVAVHARTCPCEWCAPFTPAALAEVTR